MSVYDRPSKQSTSITLYKIDSYAYAGDTVTFTGTVTSNGYPLRNALVKIFEDDPGPDERLGSGKTDSNGRFSIPWKVGAGLVETDFDIYAVYDGDSNYKRDRSVNQTLSVYKHEGNITLDSFPSSARIGEQIIFTGTLSLDNHSPEGAIVYIKDEDTLNPDDLLATGYVGKDGRFSANWFVTNVDADDIADIYAVFEGNDVFYRLTTCDGGATKSFGGACYNTKPLTIDGSSYVPPRPYVPTTDEYMELYYSLNFSHTPNVVISPSPDSYNTVRGHIIPVQEGIKMLESQLTQKYGGNWNVNFEVIDPGNIFFKTKPDIIINLVTHEEDKGCIEEFSGWARISENPKKTNPNNCLLNISGSTKIKCKCFINIRS